MIAAFALPGEIEPGVLGEPRNVEALLVAGLADLALKTPIDAATFLQQAATLEPQNEEVRQALAKALAKP